MCPLTRTARRLFGPHTRVEGDRVYHGSTLIAEAGGGHLHTVHGDGLQQCPAAAQHFRQWVESGQPIQQTGP